jgi:glycosyltransferase involved in cell wall biosynthesis
LSNHVRVVHVAEDVSKIAGGVPAVVQQLAGHLLQAGVPVEVAHAKGTRDELPSGAAVHSFPPTPWGRPWSWGRGLSAGLAEIARRSAHERIVFHIHGAWSAPQYFAARAAARANIPFLFTAHGMLEPWLWDQQGWLTLVKKRTYWGTVAHPQFKRASAVHAVTPLERDNLARLFRGKRIEVIPNAIDVPEQSGSGRQERERVILFLGRIDPKKGVDILIRAFAAAGLGSSWSIDIVGPVWSQTYLERLQALVAEHSLHDRVRFRGPLFGEDKRQSLDTAWVMATPSHSEAVGLVNLEAAVHHLPSVTTPQTGLHDWAQGGGLLTEPRVEPLAKALAMACSWSPAEQRDRGLASRQLVERRYSWKAVLPLWTELYASLR